MKQIFILKFEVVLWQSMVRESIREWELVTLIYKAVGIRFPVVVVFSI